jgi:hypothetical protein
MTSRNGVFYPQAGEGVFSANRDLNRQDAEV